MRPRPTTIALMYHEVGDDPAASGFQRRAAAPYRLTPIQLARHLDVIAAVAPRPSLVTSGDLGQPERRLFLTFDDGGRSALAAAELLARRGWPAHFFVVTARLGTRGFLAPPDLRALRALGHAVGSHSHTHPDIFRDLPWERMVGEWRDSADIVAGITGEPCRIASVPGGDISRAVLESAAAAGMQYLFTSEPWYRPVPLARGWVLGRVAVKTSTTPERLRALLELRGWGRVRLARSLKGLARRAFAPAYRTYVRWATRGRDADPPT